MPKSRVPVATGPKKVTPKPVLHVALYGFDDGKTVVTCRCGGLDAAPTFRYEDARAEFEAHKTAAEVGE